MLVFPRLEQPGLLPISEGTWLMSVFAYFDESGKYKDHTVVSVGAVVAKPSQTHRFDDEWQYCLRHLGLTYLTMKEGLDRTKPLGAKVAALGANERNVALLPFVDCIKKRLDMVIGVAVDVAAFGQMSPDAERQLTKDPHYVAFTRMVIEILNDLQDGEKISVICDDEEYTAPRIYRLYRKLKLVYPAAKSKLASLCVADDEAYTGLQAADMVASLFRLQARKAFLHEAYDYEILFERISATLEVSPQATVLALFVDRSQLEPMSEDYKRFEAKYGRYGVSPLIENKGMMKS